MIDKRIAEATECDFKVALEVKKPKSWLKKRQRFCKRYRRHTVFSVLMITEM